MNTLENLKNVLDNFGSEKGFEVFYGVVFNDDLVEIEDWNLIVFRRDNIGKSPNNTKDMKRKYTITISTENFFDDGLDLELIAAIKSGTNLKLADGDNQYEYFRKNNTGTLIETLTIDFVEILK